MWPFPVWMSCHLSFLTILPPYSPSAVWHFPLIHELVLFLPHLFPLLKMFSLPESHSPTLAFLIKFHSRSAFKSPVMTWFRQRHSFQFPQHCLHTSVETFIYSFILVICSYVCLHLDCWLLQTRDFGMHVIYTLDVWGRVWGSWNICWINDWIITIRYVGIGNDCFKAKYPEA